LKGYRKPLYSVLMFILFLLILGSMFEQFSYIVVSVKPVEAQVFHSGKEIVISDPNKGFSIRPDIAASADGRYVYVVWEDCNFTDVKFEILKGDYTHMRNIVFRKIEIKDDLSADFGVPIILSEPYFLNLIPRVDVSGSNVYVLWWASGYTEDTKSRDGLFFRKSSDNGTTWSGIKLITRDLPSWVMMVASGSNVYIVWTRPWGAGVGMGLGAGVGMGLGTGEIFFTASTDFGNTFSTPVRIGEEKANVYGEADLNPYVAASGNNVYVAWYDLSLSRAGGEIFFRASHDNEASFDPPLGTPPRNLSNTPGESQTPRIAASGNYTYVVWADFNQTLLGSRHEPPLPGEDIEIFFRKSSDNGTTWSDARNLSHNPGTSALPSIAASDSNVYVAWVDGISGFFRVFLDRSPDYGDTWWSDTFGRPIDVSLIGVPPEYFEEGWLHLFPRIAVSANYVNVVWTNLFEILFAQFCDNGGLNFLNVQKRWFLSPTRPAFNVGRMYYPPLNLALRPRVAASGFNTYIVWDNADPIAQSYGMVSNTEILFVAELPYPAKADLELLEVSPVQAIFDPIILVEGKLTLLRLKIMNTLGRPVDAQIKLAYQFAQSGQIIFQDEVTETVNVKLGLREYYLPLSKFIEPIGEVFHATATIDPENTIEEADETNNVKSSPSVIVKNTRKSRVLYVPLNVTRSGELGYCIPVGTGEVPNWEDMISFVAGSSRFIQGAYPIGEQDYQEIFTSIPVQVDVPDQSPYFETLGSFKYLTKDGLEYVLIKLQEKAYFSIPYVHAIVGVVSQDWFFAATTRTESRGIGLGDTHWWGLPGAAIVEQQYVGGAVTAHEIAHTLGWVPLDFPLGNKHHINLTTTGYWVAQRRPVPPVLDFMSPSIGWDEERWIGSLTFNFLLKQLKADPLDPDPTVILMRGVVFENSTTVLEPWYKLNGTADTQLGSSGEYKVQYLDTNGDVIGEAGFNISLTLTDGDAHT